MNTVRFFNNHRFVRYGGQHLPPEEMVCRSRQWWQAMNGRRSVRQFSNRAVPREVIENCIRAASTAPSGANKQPWTFCVVSDPDLKRELRMAAEKEEFESYHGRMNEEWLQDLDRLQTDWHKDFLQNAPYLIVVFKKSYDLVDGEKKQVYYATESCGLACGFLLTALHHCGLAALTHTPSPMTFLSRLLKRPENEKPFLLIPVGYPADECWIPDIQRKRLEEVSVWYEAP